MLVRYVPKGITLKRNMQHVTKHVNKSLFLVSHMRYFTQDCTSCVVTFPTNTMSVYVMKTAERLVTVATEVVVTIATVSGDAKQQSVRPGSSPMSRKALKAVFEFHLTSVSSGIFM